MKQTAVDYFIEQMIEYDFSPRDNTYLIEIPSWIFKEKIEKARAMMKEQIIDAYNNGDLRSAYLYYTSTYGSKDINLQNQLESKVITELSEAVSILKIHQQWRLGADIVMIEPKELTEAIDVILNYHQLKNR